LLNTLFVSLAAGLWMSTLFHERGNAVAATVALVAALTFGPELLIGSFFDRSAAPFFRLFGLAGWMTAAQMPLRLLPLFAGWFAVTHAIGWFFLWRAAVTLTTTWQDQPHAQVREPEPAQAWPAPTRVPPRLDEPVPAPATVPVPTRASWLTDPRPWDADPIRWRVERLGSAEGLVWLAMALNFFAQFGALPSVLTAGVVGADSWGLLSIIGLSVILFANGLVAWAGARFFLDSRRQQDLELLLTSPLGGRHILAAQWRVLRRWLAWPVGLVVAFALPAGLALAYDFANGYRRELWTLLHLFLIAVNLAFEAVALCWVGIWCGLRARNASTAVTGAVALVQLLPLALGMGLMWLWTWLPGPAAFPATSRRMPPVIVALLFFIVKNVGLALWARLSLRHELRLGRRSTARVRHR
jgi:hypothetical protein